MGGVASTRKHLLATAKAVHRALDFLETKNVQAYHKAILIAVYEPAKFANDEKYAEAFEAGEAYATVVAEIEDLQETALALAIVAKTLGCQEAVTQLADATRTAMQARYAEIIDAGTIARKAADLAISAASKLVGLAD